MMKEYTIQGSGRIVKINDQDFNAQKSGGQATVYIQGSTAFKVYTDPSRMIPVAKIAELSVLTHPRIIRPKDILLNKQHVAAGYSMQAVTDAYVLCQLFTRAFKERNGIAVDQTAGHVKQLRELVQHWHDKGCLVVDLNEMNFLVDKALDTVYHIDVDSGQTKSFAADALMESVRDRHSPPNVFNTGTDWFAFAVVVFQLFTGIHPYKGIHPPTEGLPPDEKLDRRMLGNISAFRKDVGVPASVYPCDIIPTVYRHWLQAVLDQGKRLAPPTDLRGAVVITPTIVRGAASNAFEITPILDVLGSVTGYHSNVTVTTVGVFLGSRKVADLPPTTSIAITPKLTRPIAAWIDGVNVRLRDLKSNADLGQTFLGEQLMATDGRIYIKQGTMIAEVTFVESAARATPGAAALIAGISRVANVMAQSTQLYDGVAIQRVFCALYASVFPKPGRHHSIRISELDDLQILDARYENQVLIVVGERSGKYYKAILRFDSAFAAYDIRWANDIGMCAVNFTALDSGVVVHITEQDEIELFSNQYGSATVKVIVDPAIGTDCRFFKQGSQALIARGGKLSSIRMR